MSSPVQPRRAHYVLFEEDRGVIQVSQTKRQAGGVTVHGNERDWLWRVIHYEDINPPPTGVYSKLVPGTFLTFLDAPEVRTRTTESDTHAVETAVNSEGEA